MIHNFCLWQIHGDRLEGVDVMMVEAVKMNSIFFRRRWKDHIFTQCMFKGLRMITKRIYLALLCIL